MGTGEHLVTVNGVSLSVESFGNPGDPTIMLLHGAAESMLAWDAAFVD